MDFIIRGDVQLLWLEVFGDVDVLDEVEEVVSMRNFLVPCALVGIEFVFELVDIVVVVVEVVDEEEELDETALFVLVTILPIKDGCDIAL